MKSHIFNNKTLQALSAKHRKSLLQISTLVWIMATISGLFGGLVTSQLLGFPFLVGFFVMFLFAFLIESFFASPTDGKSFWWARVIIAVMFAAIYALGLDTVIFQNDINNFFHEENQTKITQLDSVYTSKKEILFEKIQATQQASDSLQHSLSTWNERIFSEIDTGRGNRRSGEGKFSKKWEQMKEADSLRIAPQLAALETTIETLRNDITALETEKHEKIEQLIAPEERGFAEKLNALEALIFKGGSTSMQVMYFVWLLICIILECLVIYAKYKFNTAYHAYKREASREDSQKKALNDFESMKDTEAQQEIISQRITLNAEKEKLQARLAHQQAMKQLQLDNEKAMREKELESFNHGNHIDHIAKTTTDEAKHKNWRQQNGHHHLNGSS